MSEMKSVFEALLPPGAIWRPKPDGDFDRLLAGMGDNAQEIYEFFEDLAHVRDPRRTTILSDLEKEYGIITNPALPEADRITQLLAVKYAVPDTASWEHVQDKLRAAGFTGIVVTPNDPAIDPDIIISAPGGGELLVNGELVINQTPAYLAQANGDNTFAANGLAVCGYFVNVDREIYQYSIPDAWRYWRFFGFIGGAASGWPGSPAIALHNVNYKLESTLKRLILGYKPEHSWAVLRINYIMIWTHQTPAGAYSNTFTSGVYGSGPGLYLLTGLGAELQSSPDGINWTAQSLAGSPSDMNTSVYGDGLYVVAGNNGEIQTSPDGVIWTARTAAGGYTGSFVGSTYGNGLYVLVGDNGEIQTSPDGINWTAQTADGGYTGTFNDATYSGDLFLIVGDTGEIQTSPDGINWTAQSAAGGYTGVFYGATFGAGYFCIVGDTGEIQSSPDGINWTAQSAAGAYSGTFLDVMHGNGRFLAVGFGAEIQSSLDVVTWKQETADPPFSGFFSSAIYGAGLFVIAGQSAEIQTD
jgi:hypothetical protein